MNQIQNKPFIQIGANNGNDNFAEICKKYKPSKIVLVEPFEYLHASLRDCYKDFDCDVYYEAVCIVDNPNIKTVNLYSATGHTEHSSIIPLKDWSSEIMATVPAVTISELLNKYNISDIGLLYIDTEGYDARIIESIDFNSTKIDVIVYEEWGFLNDHYEKFDPLNGVDGMQYIKDKLTNIGYTVSFDKDFADNNHLAVMASA